MEKVSCFIAFYLLNSHGICCINKRDMTPSCFVFTAPTSRVTSWWTLHPFGQQRIRDKNDALKTQLRKINVGSHDIKNDPQRQRPLNLSLN